MFRQYLKNPIWTGAVCASSVALAREITAEIGLENASSVVEIGPGTGAFTRMIAAKKPAESPFFAVEINPDLVLEFRRKIPEVEIVEGSAGELVRFIRERKIDALDVVISGLPWACFPPALQDELLGAIYDSLSEGGHFATFAYILKLPRAMAFRKKLFARFKRVELSKVVWCNFPPAYVYRCEK